MYLVEYQDGLDTIVNLKKSTPFTSILYKRDNMRFCNFLDINNGFMLSMNLTSLVFHMNLFLITGLRSQSFVW